jgi:hypothetical protein
MVDKAKAENVAEVAKTAPVIEPTPGTAGDEAADSGGSGSRGAQLLTGRAFVFCPDRP